MALLVQKFFGFFLSIFGYFKIKKIQRKKSMATKLRGEDKALLAGPQKRRTFLAASQNEFLFFTSLLCPAELLNNHGELTTKYLNLYIPFMSCESGVQDRTFRLRTTQITYQFKFCLWVPPI